MATVGLKAIMEDDMKAGSAPLGPEDVKRLSEISAYRIDRRKAELWAHKDIKFLVYDDTDLQQNGYDSDDEDGMLEFAITVSAAEHGISRRSSSQKSEVEVVQPEPSSSETPEIETPPDGETSYDEEFSCDEEGIYEEPMCCNFCSTVPEFPRSWTPRKFRLVRPHVVSNPDNDPPGGPKVCCHYVAVSYCWPEPQKDEYGKTIVTPSTYQVRDLDGAVRPSHALDDVLDRAVEFAVSCGFRMIWIDQECLPQPWEDSPQEHKDEQELGVQAMDIVYSRALVTAGLLRAEITSHEQIVAIATLMQFTIAESGLDIRWEADGPAPSLVDVAPLLSHVIDFLEIVSADRWYTRAWVAQEALSAGKALVLVLRLGIEMSYEFSVKFVGVEIVPILSSMVSDSWAGDQSSIMAIPIEDFQRLVRAVKYFLKVDFASVADAAVPLSLANSSAHKHARSILTKVETLHPTPPNAKCLSTRMFIPGGNDYERARRTVDAVGALTLLGTRGCRDVQDRVAIVANMCYFENRLDTSILARRCKSLRLALIALTIMNGDNSLLVPEAYDLDAEEDMLGSKHSMGWLWPLSWTPHSLDYCRFPPSGFIGHSTGNFHTTFTPDGLHLSAHLWTVDDIVSFTQIQTAWIEKWSALKLLRGEMTRLEGETMDESQEHQRSVVKLFHMQNSSHQQFLAEILGRRFVRPDDGNGDLEFVGNMADLQMNIDLATQILVAEIVFDILQYLYSMAHSEPRAIGLANSIWHSLRVDAVSTEADELPDNVSDELFSHPDVLGDSSVLLQLDRTRDGSFGQSWFIERIMRDGFLWVGRYCNTTFPEQKKDLASVSISASNPRSSASETHTILQRQMIRKLIASMAGVTMAKSPTTDTGLVWDRRNMASFVDAINRKGDSQEIEEARARDLVSVFDIDGPCLVAIPHNGDWEMLPRPGLRSMSVCWVVEPVMRTKKLSGDRTERDRPSSKPPANERSEQRGPVTRSNDLHDQREVSSTWAITPAVRPESSAGQSTSQEEDKGPREEHLEDHEPSYRVLNKVRGLWQLMDDANHEYTFV